MHFLAISCFLDSWVSSKSICSHWRSSKGLRRASGRVTCTGLSIYTASLSNSEYINLHLASCSRGHCIQTLYRTERGDLQTGLLPILCSNYCSWHAALDFLSPLSFNVCLDIGQFHRKKNITKQHWKLGHSLRVSLIILFLINGK